jgi:hypothetical protein
MAFLAPAPCGDCKCPARGKEITMTLRPQSSMYIHVSMPNHFGKYVRSIYETATDMLDDSYKFWPQDYYAASAWADNRLTMYQGIRLTRHKPCMDNNLMVVVTVEFSPGNTIIFRQSETQWHCEFDLTQFFLTENKHVAAKIHELFGKLMMLN